MAEVKQVRKVARCIQTLLEAEGVTVSATKVVDLIKGKDLSDIADLKNKVASAVNDMRSKQKTKKVTVAKPNRRESLGKWIAANWDSIQENPFATEALLNAYCQGRYTKEQREALKAELLSVCEQADEEPARANDEETSDEANTELAADLMGGGVRYDF